MPLSRLSVGNYPERSSRTGTFGSQSSQLAEPLWIDRGIKSGISVCELISTFEYSPKILASEEKATPTPPSVNLR